LISREPIKANDEGEKNWTPILLISGTAILPLKDGYVNKKKWKGNLNVKGD